MSVAAVVVLVIIVAVISASVAAGVAYVRGHARGYEDCSLRWESFLSEHEDESREDSDEVRDLITAGAPSPAGRMRG